MENSNWEDWDLVRNSRDTCEAIKYRAKCMRCFTDRVLATGRNGNTILWWEDRGWEHEIVTWKCNKCGRTVPDDLHKILLIVNGINQ